MANSDDASADRLKKAVDISVKLGAMAQTRRRGGAAKHAQPEQTRLQLMLPQISCNDRLLPNALARGALFNATKTGDGIKRGYYEGRVVASLSNLKIVYQGQELRQDDASVFIALLHFQKNSALEEKIYFTAYAMLKELGWSVNKDEYKHLRDCCTRLSATNLTISFSDGSENYAGSLLRDFAWMDTNDKKLAKWYVRFESNIAQFFRADSFCLIDPKMRRKISGRAPLAQWLHSFYSTHHEPIPMSVAKYHELTDSNARDLWDFRARLKLALQRLVENHFLHSFLLKDDLVFVKRVVVKRQSPVYRSIALAGSS